MVGRAMIKKQHSISAMILFIMILLVTQLSSTHVYAKHGFFSGGRISLRKFPAPYEAMIAIDSDADHTDLRKFNEVHSFLNSFADTPMGKGLGLDISDSMFLYNGSNINTRIDDNNITVSSEMTMFKGISNTPSIYAPILLYYIKHGWIDTFHSAGDYSLVDQYQTLFTRSQEQYALNWLAKQHVPPILDFTDHGNMSNVANFGAWWYGGLDSSQEGDNPQSPYYIVDLLHKEGVRFVWNSRLYSTFSNQSMIFPIHLRDGSWIWGYHRYTGYANTANAELWNPYNLAKELSVANLQTLIQSHGFAIVATHLEGNADKQPLSGLAIQSLIHLAHLQYDTHQLLVASTSRLLWYNLVEQGISYHTSFNRQTLQSIINIKNIHDPVDGTFYPDWQQLRGITWNVSHPSTTIIEINGSIIPSNDLFKTKNTIGIKWYPQNTKNWELSLYEKQYQATKQTMIQNER